IGHIFDLFTRPPVFANDSSPEPVKLPGTFCHPGEIDYFEEEVLVFDHLECPLRRETAVNGIDDLDCPKEEDSVLLSTFDLDKPLLTINGYRCTRSGLELFFCCTAFSDKHTDPASSIFTSCIIFVHLVF